MSRKSRLRACNSLLLGATALMCLSAIQLEATGSQEPAYIRVHIALGTCLTLLTGWHLYLHFAKHNWTKKILGLKKKTTKWLALLCTVSILSGGATTFHWTATYAHSPLGGVHGKIGFLFLMLAIGHAAKRRRYYMR